MKCFLRRVVHWSYWGQSVAEDRHASSVKVFYSSTWFVLEKPLTIHQVLQGSMLTKRVLQSLAIQAAPAASRLLCLLSGYHHFLVPERGPLLALSWYKHLMSPGGRMDLEEMHWFWWAVKLGVYAFRGADCVGRNSAESLLEWDFVCTDTRSPHSCWDLVWSVVLIDWISAEALQWHTYTENPSCLACQNEWLKSVTRGSRKRSHIPALSQSSSVTPEQTSLESPIAARAPWKERSLLS